MSHTNSTSNYSLPQFITTDKPAWLTDVNNAYLAIDTAMKNNADAASTAQGDATQAITDAGNADTKATTAKNAADGALASIADEYLSTNTYAVNDLVIYNSLLYKCNTAISTPEAWNASHWTRVSVETQLNTKANSSSLATVATTGQYSDLNGKPSIPVFSGRTVKATNTSGTIWIAFSELNCTAVPKVIIANCNSADKIIIYSHSESEANNNITLHVYNLNGTPAASNTIEIGMIVYQ